MTRAMASAVRTQLSACLGFNTGEPQNAMTQSPMYLSSVPS